jgi:hypothetical protein
MKDHDRQLSRRLKDAAPGFDAPDFDTMWRRAEDVARAANSDEDAPRSRRAPLLITAACAAALLLAAALWSQRPDVAAPLAPPVIAAVEQPAPVVPAGEPAPEPADDALAEAMADGQWDAPTDFLLAEGDAFDLDDEWETMWDEPLDEQL